MEEEDKKEEEEEREEKGEGNDSKNGRDCQCKAEGEDRRTIARREMGMDREKQRQGDASTMVPERVLVPPLKLTAPASAVSDDGSDAVLLSTSTREGSMQSSNRERLSTVRFEWRRLRCIGRGFSSSVYESVRLDTGELMAVKEIVLHGGVAEHFSKTTTKKSGFVRHAAMLLKQHRNEGFTPVSCVGQVELRRIPKGPIRAELP